MWLMKTLLTSRCINQRGAGHDKDDEKTLKRLSGFKYNLEEKDPNYDLITALESMKVIYG